MTSVEMPPAEGDPEDEAARQELRELFALEQLHRRGPGSRVYLARDLEYDQPVAVKVIPRAAGADAAVEEAFHRAAATAAALEHPHIVPLYSAGVTGRLWWWSMPYVEGQSLAELLQSGSPLEFVACLHVAQQVADGLDFAHRLGVIHADLKPANVLVDAAGDAHVTDFWVPWTLAQLGGAARGGEDEGSAPYVAPEQRLRREAGPAGDQYALATLVYTCLSGAPPLVEDPMMAIAAGRTPEPAPRLDQVLADIPAWVSRALERAMSRAPDARYPTARDFVLALETPPTPPVSGRALALGGYEALGRHPGHGLNWRWVPAGLLTLVAFGAVLAPWLLSSRPATDRRAEADTGSVARAAAESLALAAVVPDSHAPALSPSSGPVVSAAPAARSPVSTDTSRRLANAPPRRPTPARRPAPRTDAAAERVGAPGRLFVNATPWGQVYVDGDLVGNTPQVGVPVSPGAHRLRVVRDGFESYEVAIHIAPGQELRLTDIVLREQRP